MPYLAHMYEPYLVESEQCHFWFVCISQFWLRMNCAEFGLCVLAIFSGSHLHRQELVEYNNMKLNVPLLACLCELYLVNFYHIKGLNI